MAELGSAVERIEAEADSLQGGDDRRHHGGHAQCLGGALVRLDVDEWPQTQLVGGDRQGGAHSPERWPRRRRQWTEHGRDRCGQHPMAGDLGAERRQLAIVGQVPDGDEVPDLLEGVVSGQVGGIVAAVVEEARFAVDVADGGVGDGDAVETGGDIDEVAHDLNRDWMRGLHQC